MFDIGWQELFLVALITIIVVGPKELPRVLRTVTLWIRKVRSMAREFQDGIDDLAREADLEDLRKDIEKGAGVDFGDEIERTIDPSGEMKEAIEEIGGALEDTKDTINDPKIAADNKPSSIETDTVGPDSKIADPKIVSGKTENAG